MRYVFFFIDVFTAALSCPDFCTCVMPVRRNECRFTESCVFTAPLVVLAEAAVRSAHLAFCRASCRPAAPCATAHTPTSKCMSALCLFIYFTNTHVRDVLAVHSLVKFLESSGVPDYQYP
ncbi:unnamed protein product, partial [Pylaiella littoralis]